jgi:hypothetical protein
MTVDEALEMSYRIGHSHVERDDLVRIAAVLSSEVERLRQRLTYAENELEAHDAN